MKELLQYSIMQALEIVIFIIPPDAEGYIVFVFPCVSSFIGHVREIYHKVLH